LSGGDKIDREIKVSWYGAEPVTQSRFAWALNGGNNVADSGEWNVNTIRPGTVASLGKLTFTLISAIEVVAGIIRVVRFH